MDIFRLTGVVDLKIDEFKAKATQFEAEIKKLENKILELRKAKLVDGTTSQQIRDYNDEIRKLNVDLKEQRVEYGRLKTEASRYAQSVNVATKAQTQFRSQVGASNGVAQEFNRIIQDAPFGIIGIGNNLQQLASNFSAVRASAGSTGKAIAQSFASIISPINLGLLAVSAITSAFTAYQLGMFDSTESTKEFKTESEKLADTLSGLEKTLGAVERARLNSAKSAQDELVKLSLLKDVIEDTNRPLSERAKAYQSLREIQPDITKNLSIEKALTEGLGQAYLDVVSAITQRATAIAIEEELVRIAKERISLLKVEQQQTDLQNKLIEEKNRLEQERAKITQPLTIATAGGTVVTEAGEQYKKLTGEILAVDNQLKLLGNTLAVDTTNALNQNSTDTKNLSDQWKSLNLEFAGVVGGSKDANNALGDLDDDLKKYTINVKDYQEKFEKLIEALGRSKGITPAEDLKFITPKDFSEFLGLPDAKTFEEQAKAINDPLGEFLAIYGKIKDVSAGEALGGNPFSFLVDSIFSLRAVNEELDGFTGNFEEKAELIREKALLLGNVFSGIGDVIANTFFRGDRAMGRFVSALGDFVGQSIILAQAISKAKSIEASASAVSSATQASASLGPVGFFTLAPFIASALALVSSAFSSFGGQKAGGGGFAGASASANAIGTSFTAGGLGFAGFGNFELTSKVSGTDIKLVLTRTETANA
jgi:hypothetical protein